MPPAHKEPKIFFIGRDQKTGTKGFVDRVAGGTYLPVTGGQDQSIPCTVEEGIQENALKLLELLICKTPVCDQIHPATTRSVRRYPRGKSPNSDLRFSR